MRYAIYFTADPATRLWTVAHEWLESNTTVARAYGVHATLKPPFFLVAGRSEEQLVAELQRVADTHATIGHVALRLDWFDNFLALVPTGSHPHLIALVEDIMRDFDYFRAPASADETARRRLELLSARQLRYLAEWGYPYVFDDFRFHLTLTDRVEAHDRPDVEQRLAHLLGALPATGLAIDTVSLCRQPAVGERFEVVASFGLVGSSSEILTSEQRMIAP